jgi:hypothetical protein
VFAALAGCGKSQRQGWPPINADKHGSKTKAFASLNPRSSAFIGGQSCLFSILLEREEDSQLGDGDEVSIDHTDRRCGMAEKFFEARSNGAAKRLPSGARSWVQAPTILRRPLQHPSTA